nr:hypothetical protein Iba_chr04fCG11430 [Ipomoea batatas]
MHIQPRSSVKPSPPCRVQNQCAISGRRNPTPLSGFSFAIATGHKNNENRNIPLLSGRDFAPHCRFFSVANQPCVTTVLRSEMPCVDGER